MRDRDYFDSIDDYDSETDSLNDYLIELRKDKSELHWIKQECTDRLCTERLWREYYDDKTVDPKQKAIDFECDSWIEYANLYTKAVRETSRINEIELNIRKLLTIQRNQKAVALYERAMRETLDNSSLYAFQWGLTESDHDKVVCEAIKQGFKDYYDKVDERQKREREFIKYTSSEYEDDD